VILYTLDRKQEKRQLIIYLGVTIFALVFGYIYELFSHNVYSPHMALMFLYPGILGLGPTIIIYICKGIKRPDDMVRILFHCGVLTLTVGSMVNGILQIYGTTSKLVPIYYIIGIILILSGVIRYFLLAKPEKKR
jgi:predicted membrane channel-forming protein YqfA (hemolysin III family)